LTLRIFFEGFASANKQTLRSVSQAYEAVRGAKTVLLSL
jgi:hypothetical protein